MIEGAGVYLDHKMDHLGFKLIMIMSIYENTVELSLSYNEGYVFDVNMEFVEREKGY
nr:MULTISPECIES: hypothetical protein [Bacillus]